MEIFWPLFLFLILVLVRTRGLRKEHHQCYFDEKAMPSAGLMAFAQSFICTFNNTCHSHIREDFTQSDILSYNDSFINALINDVETALENNFNEENVDALSDVFNDFQTLNRIYSNVAPRLLNGEAVDGLTVAKVSSLIKNPDVFRLDLLRFAMDRGLILDPDEISAFLEATLRPENVSPAEFIGMLTDPRNAICDPKVSPSFI